MSDSELLLSKKNKRYSIFPIQYKDIWDCYLTHKKTTWFVNEVNLSSDIKDWVALNDDEQYFIKHILAFFAASDGIVMENLDNRFINEVQIMEAQFFYTFQSFIESEHSLMYSLLIETYINDEAEKSKLFNAIEEIPVVKQKAEWALKWLNSDDSFATRLVAFAVVEGIFFSGAFCSIYWLSERGVMPGLCMSNEFIARDEALHCNFAVLLYTKYIQNKLTQLQIENIIKEAVEIEKQFIVKSLPCSLLGMNAGMMSEYIEFVADRLIQQLQYKPIYNSKNPFPFMGRICLQNQTNFFEQRVSEYQKTVDVEEVTRDSIDFDADF